MSHSIYLLTRDLQKKKTCCFLTCEHARAWVTCTASFASQLYCISWKVFVESNRISFHQSLEPRIIVKVALSYFLPLYLQYENVCPLKGTNTSKNISFYVTKMKFLVGWFVGRYFVRQTPIISIAYILHVFQLRLFKPNGSPLLIEDFRMDKIGNMYEEQLLSTVTPSQENISWFDRELQLCCILWKGFQHRRNCQH